MFGPSFIQSLQRLLPCFFRTVLCHDPAGDHHARFFRAMLCREIQPTVRLRRVAFKDAWHALPVVDRHLKLRVAIVGQRFRFSFLNGLSLDNGKSLCSNY